jgi:hypothetical protein
MARNIEIKARIGCIDDQLPRVTAIADQGGSGWWRPRMWI